MPELDSSGVEMGRRTAELGDTVAGLEGADGRGGVIRRSRACARKRDTGERKREGARKEVEGGEEESVASLASSRPPEASRRWPGDVAVPGDASGTQLLLLLAGGGRQRCPWWAGPLQVSGGKDFPLFSFFCFFISF